MEVTPGDHVQDGDCLCVLEAMKMHNGVRVLRAGRVRKVHVSAGDHVTHGQPLVEIE